MHSTKESSNRRWLGLGGMVTLGVAALLVAAPFGCSKQDEQAKPKAATTTTQAAPPSTEAQATAPLSEAQEHFNKGLQASIKGDYDTAIAEYKKTIELDPKSAEAYNNIGFAYYDMGDMDKAVELQKKALEINPNLPNGYYGLALALEKKGDMKGALESWKSFIKFAEPHSKWWLKAQERITELEGGSTEKAAE